MLLGISGGGRLCLHPRPRGERLPASSATAFAASARCCGLRARALVPPSASLRRARKMSRWFSSGESSLQPVGRLPLRRCIICRPGLKKDLVAKAFNSGLPSGFAAASRGFGSTEGRKAVCVLWDAAPRVRGLSSPLKRVPPSCPSPRTLAFPGEGGQKPLPVPSL